MKISKKIISVGLLVMLFTVSIPGFASSKYDRYGSWSEPDAPHSIQKTYEIKAWEPVWKLRATGTYSFSQGNITLKSYTMELLNDTKLCKAVTTHSAYFRGYARARFETLLGSVNSGSDTGRVYGNYGATAETPDNLASGGWSGIAKTYCGVD